MARYKQTSEIVKIINDRERVRNLGIIAHIDHGKTTLSDSLLSASGLLSPSVAGEARALDFLEEEQARGITINTANISLLHEYNDTSYVINLIDTPGHIDFTGKVTRALRAIDGAVVVVDAVEEIMVQTETVTRQALAERVRPLLYINKVDRLITELRLKPEDIQKKLAKVIASFNKLIDIFCEDEYKDEWMIKPGKNNVAFGSAKDRWGFTLKMAQEHNITFSDIYKHYENKTMDELREKANISHAILNMATDHVPPPTVAQKYRIPVIWKGDLESEIGQSMINCSGDGPVALMVTNVTVDEKAGIIATGRLLSGTLKPGTDVYLINNQDKDRVLQVGMYMGPYRENVQSVIAGNIPAILGLEKVTAGETVSGIEDMASFEAINYVSEPVVTVAIEPKHSRELPKLISGLRRLALEDPNLVVKINEETGEYLLSGMGALHLEVAGHNLDAQGLDVTISQPIVVYRETVTQRSDDFPGKSPNKHNKLLLYCDPLDDKVLELITSNKINDNMDRKEISRALHAAGWPMDQARNIWNVDERGNILVNMTRGIQYLDETKSMIISAFQNVCNEGILSREPTRGIRIMILDVELHEDPAHRTYAQMFPATRRAINGSILTAAPAIFEPIMKIVVQITPDYMGAISSVISSKRGAVIAVDQRDYFTVVTGEIPLSETFDLSQVLRGATAGKAFWNLVFGKWRLLPKSLRTETIQSIRKRNGLPENIPNANDFRPLM